jgi:5-methylthioadenosine/S-adenosylhomocysteine deaminase
MQTQVDLLIEPGWIIPIEPFGVVLREYALAVDKGRILSLLPVDQARARFAPREHFRLPDQALLPGLVNAHTHAAMSLLRGYADDLTLMRWLEDRIWPAERACVSPDFIRDGTKLAAWEMLRGGVTCFNDMYFFPGAAAEAVREAGIRAVLGVTVVEFPTSYAADAADYLAKGLAVRDACRDEPLITFSLSPHAPYTVSDRTFERIAMLVAQLDLPVHIHLHETRAEIEESLSRHGLRPIERLRRLGFLAPNLVAVHAVHLDTTEISQLAECGCSVVHCPTSNLKLASGIAPVAAMLQAGIQVALGTDGAASNNRLDVQREMRQASLLAKAASGDATAVSVHQALHMATLAGASALGLETQIGSLVPGKWADLCTVRVENWTNQPCYDPASHVVHVVGREDISHVWVAGALRLREGNPVGVTAEALIEIGTSWHNKLCLRGLDGTQI